MVANKIIFTFIFLLIGVQQEVKVNRRLTAVKIPPIYAPLANDQIISYRKDRYLVMTIEDFDEDGSINCVQFWKPDEYLEFKRNEFSKIKNFLKSCNVELKMNCQIINKKIMKVDNATVNYESTTADPHTIYYKEKNAPQKLFVLKI